MPAAARITYTVTGTIDPTATGTLTNTATVTAPTGVTDTDTANNTATDTDTLTPQADLSITKTDGKTTRGAGHGRHLHHRGDQHRPEHGHWRDGGGHHPGLPDRHDPGQPRRRAEPRAFTTCGSGNTINDTADHAGGPAPSPTR